MVLQGAKLYIMVAMGKFGVRPEKELKLFQRMDELGIKESDLKERFIRAQGPGGQHVNKTSTCVQIEHKPSKIVVKAQTERSQALNRFLARRLLVERFEELLDGVETKKKLKEQKIRKQKLKRKKRTKQKLSEIKDGENP